MLADPDWSIFQGITRQMVDHFLAALSEWLCPFCAASLTGDGDCTAPGHRPVRFHVCPTGFTYSFLDVPARVVGTACYQCGQPYGRSHRRNQ